MLTVLFVCIENSCRSQMAEGFAKMLGAGRLEAYSCGSRPSGTVNEKAIAAMQAIGYDMGAHVSKGPEALAHIDFDWVVTMGCGDACPDIRAKARANWEIPDPKAMEGEQFSEIRDRIRERVRSLIDHS